MSGRAVFEAFEYPLGNTQSARAPFDVLTIPLGAAT
jgi:hypothetical protein